MSQVCPKCGAEILDPLIVYAGIPKLSDEKDRQIQQLQEWQERAKEVLEATANASGPSIAGCFYIGPNVKAKAANLLAEIKGKE